MVLMYILDGKEEGIACMAVMYPNYGPSYQNCEVVFLIDRSGSMDGAQIESAKSALQLLLRSLTDGVKFNSTWHESSLPIIPFLDPLILSLSLYLPVSPSLSPSLSSLSLALSLSRSLSLSSYKHYLLLYLVVGFGSTFTALFNESQLYSESTFKQATAYTDTIRADLGGTEILQPLEWICRSHADPAYPRQIFVLTDGQVSNEAQVVTMVKHAAGEYSCLPLCF